MLSFVKKNELFELEIITTWQAVQFIMQLILPNQLFGGVVTKDDLWCISIKKTA